MADESKQFRLQVISPDRIVYDDNVEMVELKTTEGEIGVYKGHIPLTAVLSPGVLRITEQSGIRKAALHNGFVEIFSDHVIILAESCEWPEEIDINRAREAQIRAERRLKSGGEGINTVRAEAALRRAITRINIVDSELNK